MPSAKIRADYDQLAQFSQIFSQQNSDLAKTNKQIKSAQDTLQGGEWIGQGASAFYKEMDGEVNPSLKRLENAMAEAANITNQISKVMKEAEDESSTILAIILTP